MGNISGPEQTQSNLVSVIIVNYNGRKNLREILTNCLTSILETDYANFEVLFIDNASEDDSVKYVKETFGQDPRMQIICNKQNFGFAEGNNVGIRRAHGAYIALVNSDTRVEPDWLKNLVRAVQPAEIGAAQSKLLQMSHPTLLDCAGGLVDYYGYHFEVGRGEEASKYQKTRPIFYGKGASLLLKREALEKSGLFDPEFFMYFDEVDLCWRLWLSGSKVVYAPLSVVYHASGSTTAKMRSQSRLYFYTRNHLLIVLKNFSLLNVAKAVNVSLLFETRNAIVRLLRREPLEGLAIAKAMFWNLRHLKETWAKRQTVQKLIRRTSDEEIRKHMLEPCPPFPLYIVFPRSRYCVTETT